MTKAYSYIRMSTDKQLLGDSLRRQTERAEEFCEKHQLELDQHFQLHDIGRSAFTGDNIENGELGKFVQAVRDKIIEPGSYLIIESHDRMSRMSPKLALPIFLEILNANIFIAVLSENKIFRPDSDNQYDLMEALFGMARAHDESLRKSDRAQRTWKNKRDNASKKILTRLAPGWLVSRDDKSGFELREDRVTTVKLIFELAFTSGLGAFAITRELNNRKIPTFGRAKHGWQKSSVDRILTNVAVIGDFEPSTIVASKRHPTGEVLHGYFPAIIDPERFYTIRHNRKSRASGGGGRVGNSVSNLFTKVVECGYCGGPMVLIDKGTKSGKFLVCDRANRKHGCHLSYWSYADFEKSFLTFITEIDLARMNSEFIHSEALVKLRHEIQALKGRQDAAEVRRQKIFDMLMANLATDYLQKQLGLVDQEVAQLKASVTELEQQQQKLQSENKSFEQGSQNLTKILDEVAQRNSDDLRSMRLKLREGIRDTIAGIQLFPIGAAKPDNWPVTFIESIQQPGVSRGRFSEFLSKNIVFSNTNDRRKRFFKVYFKDGKTRRIKPLFDDPTRFEWWGDSDSPPITQKQVFEMAKIWGLDPSIPTEFDKAMAQLRVMSDHSAKLAEAEYAAYCAKINADKQ